MGRPAKKEAVQKFKVNNTEIIIGNTYKIVSKPDYDAPAPINGDGKGTVKLPFPQNKEGRSIVWNDTTRRWDTGFDINSDCNKRIEKSEKEVLINLYNQLVKEPYEDFYNEDLDATNDDFWGGNDKIEKAPYMYEIGLGVEFDTRDPKQRLDLFQAVIQGKVCEEGEKDSELQRSAVYCIKNKDKSISTEEERILNKSKAVSTFINLLDAFDPKKDDSLYNILEWMKFSNIRGSEKAALQKVVLKAFEMPKTGTDSVNLFLEAYEMTQDPNKKKEMELFSMLTVLNNKKKLEFKRNNYYLNEEFVGANLRIGAKQAMSKQELAEKIVSAYEEIN